MTQDELTKYKRTCDDLKNEVMRLTSENMNLRSILNNRDNIILAQDNRNQNNERQIEVLNNEISRWRANSRWDATYIERLEKCLIDNHLEDTLKGIQDFE